MRGSRKVMAFHVVLPRRMHLADQAEKAALMESPRHAMGLIAGVLGAAVHEPSDFPIKTVDRIRAKIAPSIEMWSLARQVKSTANPGDVIFCSSEAGGLQLAAIYACSEPRPRIAVFVHNVDRPRARLAMRLWRMRSKIDLFVACAPAQVDFLRNFLRLPANRVRHVFDHTDTCFFSPGATSAGKRRPLIASVGLEQRDYVTLASATADLDVDVRISGFSKDAKIIARSFPPQLPNNMTRRFYEWPELVQLYRDANVVVVSCHQNKYAAGVQSLIEAAACRRPVIVTATEGLRGYINDSVVTIEPGDAEGMRTAILKVLQNSPVAEARASRSYELARRLYRMERYVTEISDLVRSLA
jgi:glycosyltransferase involved in cell wall biosynthesis